MARIITGDRAGRGGKIRLGCSAAVWDEARERILLIRRSDNGLWSLPSGGLEPGESMAEGAEREVLEETGLRVRVTGVIGLYSSPHVLVEYADGNRFQIVSACLEARVIGGALSTTDEAMEVGWFSEGALEELLIMENHVERIADIFAFTGTTFLK